MTPRDNRLQRAPASGERRAIGGYQGQYRFGAERILRQLRSQSLEWIRLADPEAGRVDDLQIATPGRLDAYQVKWSRYPGTVTFRELTLASSNAPSLINQLADGWKRLRRANPGRRVVVHLTTNDRPSTADRVPGGDETGKAGHTAAFLAQSWFPHAAESDRFDATATGRWSAAWDLIIEKSGLSRTEFGDFLRDCKLDFETSLSDRSADEMGLRDGGLIAAGEAATWQEDVNGLTQLLYQIVAEPEGRIELSRQRLLEELHWVSRVEFRSRHEFPDPEIPYEEIAATVNDLVTALEVQTGGYVLLLGTPGSGKSTLLERSLRYRPERVISYYAYVRNSSRPNARRGEALNFLHDTVLAIEDHGFRVGDTLPPSDLDILAARFHDQLKQLGSDYEQTGRRTILVVDGLDHIAREQSPSRSLLVDLPEPNSLPDGVFVVLGSQTADLPGLPTAVASQLENPSRRVEMKRLAREAVLNVVANGNLDPAPNDQEIDEIFRLSDGHPLALAYIVNSLRGAPETPVESVLDDVQPFEERIDDQYLAHWQAIAGEQPVVRLFAKLARIRGSFDFSWVEKWADRSAIYILNHRFAHYFSRERDSHWSFFHNSFRVFLQQKTATLPGVSGTTGDADLFKELADHCAAASIDDPSRWDQLFYLTQSGDHAAVLAAADRVELRQQFMAGRLAEEIVSDLKSALRSAEQLGDVVAFARLILAAAEFAQRAMHLQEVPLAELLLALGHSRAAVDHTRKNRDLLISPNEAIGLSLAMDSAGMRDEAELVFSLAEPLEILTCPQALPPEDYQGAERNLLAWVDVAPRFRSLSQILTLIDGLRRGEDSRLDVSAEEATDTLRNRLRFHLILGLSSSGRWQDIGNVASAWELDNESHWDWWFWSHMHLWRDAQAAGQDRVAREFLDQAREAVQIERLDDEQRTVLTEGLLRVGQDYEAARKLIASVPQPDPADLTGAWDSGFQPFAQRFRLNRLLSALGEEADLPKLVPSSHEEDLEEVETFERLVVSVARIHGRAWAAEKMSAATIELIATPILRFTSRPFNVRATGRVSPAAKTELHRLLIAGAAQHGAGAVDTLAKAYASEWSMSEHRARWPVDLIRECLLALFRAGADAQWAVNQLEELEDTFTTFDEASERLRMGSEQIKAYLAVGQRGKARPVFDRLLRSSFAVGYKDDQFFSWVEWAQRANSVDPAGAGDRVVLLASCMPAIAGTEYSSSVAEEVLKTAFRANASMGFDVLRWSLDRGLFRFVDGLETLLLELLGNSDCPPHTVASVYQFLLLPFDASPGSSLARSLTTHLASSVTIGLLRQVADTVLTQAISTSRPALLASIDEAASAAELVGWTEVAPSKVQGSERSSEDSSRHLSNFLAGPESEDDIRAQATSLDAVLEISRREKGDSLFRWDRILSDLAGRLNRDEVVTLADHFADHRRASSIASVLSRRLTDLGETAASWAVASRAVCSARPYAWRQHMGDERVPALSSLIAADAGPGRAKAFNTVIHDLTTEQVSVRDIALELHRITPLLTEDEPVIEVWAEVKAHLEELVSVTEGTAEPTLSDPAGAEVELLRFAAEYLAHPAQDLANGAQRVFVDLLLRKNPVALQVMAERLRAGDPGVQVSVLMLGIAVTEVDPAALATLEDDAVMLLSASEQNLRYWSREFLRRLGKTPAPGATGPASSPIELPAVYRLSFRERGEFKPLREHDSTEFLAPTDDPAELVLPFQADLDFIAQTAGLQREALYARVAQLAPSAGSAESATQERELRRKLDAIGLKIPYRRPRASSVRLAIFRAFAELVDAGRISPERAWRIEHLLREGDPTTLRMRPAQRPVWIDPIEERGESNYVRDHWTASATAAAGALLRHSQEEVVVAEETWLRWLDWKMATEVRSSTVVPEWIDPKDLEEAEDPLRTLSVLWRRTQINEYRESNSSDSRPLVLQHAFEFDTPIDRWLAINPAVAHKLNWVLSPDGLFRWEDRNGDLMAQSVWWQDGYEGHRPPQFECEVGYGWVVTLSPPGWEAVRSLYEALYACRTTRRQARDQPDVHVATIGAVAD